MIHEYEFVLILDRNIVASIHCMWLCVSGRKKIAAKMLGSVQSFSNFRDDCGHDVRGGHAKGNVELRSEMRVKTGLREVSELRTGMSAMRGEWERTVQEKLQTLDQVPKKSRRAEERTVLEPGPAMCEAFAERFAALESRMSARLEASEQAAKEKEEQRVSAMRHYSLKGILGACRRVKPPPCKQRLSSRPRMLRVWLPTADPAPGLNMPERNNLLP